MTNNVATSTSWKPGFCPNPGGRPKGHQEVKMTFLNILLKNPLFLEEIIANPDESTRNRLEAYGFCLKYGIGTPLPMPDKDDSLTDASKMATPALISSILEANKQLVEQIEQINKDKKNEKN